MSAMLAMCEKLLVSDVVSEVAAMTTIKATCPSCGDIDLKPRDIHVTVAQAAGWATYSFRCPACDDQISKSADDEVVALLKGAGVVVERIHVPSEALEAHYGAPIGPDDLIDFALTMGVTDELVQVLRQEASAGR
ncbi:MAG: hypothetical protein U0904_06190 [Candidatus Nanopelagicales bacterium]|nr:hypothetical protein [Candidatus Nanopelagicales bacterium]